MLFSCYLMIKQDLLANTIHFFKKETKFLIHLKIKKNPDVYAIQNFFIFNLSFKLKAFFEKLKKRRKFFFCVKVNKSIDVILARSCIHEYIH